MYREHKSVNRVTATLESLRDKLAELLTTGEPTVAVGPRAADLANQISLWEGALEAYSLADAVMTRGTYADPAATLRELLTQRLLNGADDAWSGRGNDARRATFDGFRDAARDILTSLEG